MSSTIGRPTKYKPEFCEILIKHMKSGLSFDSFAAVIGVSEDSIYEWAKVHQEFSDSKKEAFSQNRLFWDNIAVNSVSMKSLTNPTMVIFNLKNRFPKQWRDRTEQQIDAKVEASSQELDSLKSDVKSMLDELKSRSAK